MCYDAAARNHSRPDDIFHQSRTRELSSIADSRGLEYSRTRRNFAWKRGLIRENATRKESDKRKKNTRECLRISPLERSIRSRKVIDLAASLLTRCISILSACLRKLVSILAVADTDERRGDGGGGGEGREREIARELPSNGDSKINHLVMPNKRIRPRESFYFREKIVVLSRMNAADF